MNPTPFSLAYASTSSMSTSAWGVTKSCPFHSPPAFWFQPSASTYLAPDSTARSTYSLMRAVVAPCLGPAFQVVSRRCSSHHTPTYVPGSIQSVVSAAPSSSESTSQMAHGAFRFSMRCDAARSSALRPTVSVRQGVPKPSASTSITALSPFGSAMRSETRVPGVVPRTTVMLGKSIRAASCRARKRPSSRDIVIGVCAEATSGSGCVR